MTHDRINIRIAMDYLLFTSASIIGVTILVHIIDNSLFRFAWIVASATAVLIANVWEKTYIK